MKAVTTYILKEGDGTKFHFDLALGKTQEPTMVINRLLTLKNRTLCKGELPVELVRVRLRNTKVTYQHDWEKVDGSYRCVDCGIKGVRENMFSRIHTFSKLEKYKDCSWSIKL